MTNVLDELEEIAQDLQEAGHTTDSQRVRDVQESLQDMVEEIDSELQETLNHAEIYTSHDKVRPSALVAFDHVGDARLKLDELDQREFTDD